MGPRKWRRTALVALALICALLVGLRIVRQVVSPHPSASAQAIIRGFETARVKNAGDDEDPNLRADEFGLGGMWARANRPTDVGQCPAHSAAFRNGCAAYIENGRP